MEKYNYHTHTGRCKHGCGSEAEYVQAAIEKGITVLGMSDHCPFPYGEFPLRMDYEELDPYLEALDRERELHKDELKLLKGVEIEYLPQYDFYYRELLEKRGVDYLLLGQHVYMANEKMENIYLVKSTECFLDYAKSIADALDTGYFKMVAHPDIYSIIELPWDDNSRRAQDIILEAAVKHGTILEFNANGIRRGQKPYPEGERYMYPMFSFWEEVAKTGIRAVVGSDAHRPADVWDPAVEFGWEYLKKLGIETQML